SGSATTTTTELSLRVASGLVGDFVGLPADVYALHAFTPASELFWQGSADLGELVVVDPARQLKANVDFKPAGLPAHLQTKLQYAGSVVAGTLSLSCAVGLFQATTVDWLAVTGGDAVVQATGTLAGRIATLRLVAHDRGPSGTGDSLSASMSD